MSSPNDILSSQIFRSSRQYYQSKSNGKKKDFASKDLTHHDSSYPKSEGRRTSQGLSGYPGKINDKFSKKSSASCSQNHTTCDTCDKSQDKSSSAQSDFKKQGHNGFQRSLKKINCVERKKEDVHNKTSPADMHSKTKTIMSDFTKNGSSSKDLWRSKMESIDNLTNSKPLKDQEVSKESHVMSLLEIYLSISISRRKCIEKDPVFAMIEAHISKALHSNLIHVSLEETRIFMKRNKTEWCFLISSNDISMAKKKLNIIVTELKEELKELTIFDRIEEISVQASSKDLRKETFPHQQSLQKNTLEKMNALKTDVKKALNDIRKTNEDILHSHDEKIGDIRKKIDNYLLRESGFDLITEKDIEDKNILLQKIEELKMQRSEFVQRCNKLLQELQSLDFSTGRKEDIIFYLKSIGIECKRISNALPIYAKRKDIVTQVKTHQVSIILGETGSGKSTQLAQYLYEAGFAKSGSIICTQPRRIAAITLAERVAEEMVENVGSLVGYKAGMGKKVNKDTKIIFTTDHFLLNECLKDQELREYSCIIVDEAHERSIYTDILLGIIKRCMLRRPELKIVITSATIDPEVFIQYFNSGPELRVSGKIFPVEVFYADNAQDDFEKYEEKAVSKAIEIHSNEEPGDILIFLCSPVEIMRCCEEFEKRYHGKVKCKCFPLHGQLPSEEQKRVFEKLPIGTRKIVFATNCAETSITIDGIKHVIDSGVAKEMKYDPRRNMNQLGIHAISKSSANQRKGRAGRTASGKCYRLYSEDGFEAMDSINDPEILRVHLGQAALKLSELGVDIKSYDFVQAPSEDALNSAIETLEYLGAIVDNQITDIGKWISKLPFDPKLGYMVYEANKMDLLFDAVVLASVLSSGSDLFYRGFSETEAQVVAKSKVDFGSKYGDTFTWLQVFKAWSDVPDDKKKTWCQSHCINSKCINFVRQSIKDVKTMLSRDLGIEMRQNFSSKTEDMDELRKILFKAHAHSISNFSDVSRAGYFSLISERQVHVHPSSILMALNLQPEWLVYTNLIRTSKEFIKGITVVEEEWLLEHVKNQKLNIDIMKAKQNKFVCVHHEEMGPAIFRAVVGPCFSNLQVLEEAFLNSGLLRSILEVRRDLGTLDIHSPFSMKQCALDKLNEIKSATTQKLLAEDFEISLSKKESIVSSGTRVVIGKGGCVKNIFMPDQSDKVLIKRIKSTVTESEILSKFEEFGEIKEIIQFKSHDPWGFVRFSSVAEAISAVDATKNDKFYAGMLKLDKHAKNVKNMFEAKMTWIRRPIKGKGTAFIKCSPVHHPLLLGSTIWALGRPCEIKLGKKGDLVIFNTGSLKENEVKDKVDHLMDNLNLSKKDLEVSVSREFVEASEEDLNTKVNCISYFVKKYMKEDGFKISMLKPKNGSINYVCFLSFTDPVRGYEVCRRMGHKLFIDNRPVEVSIFLKTIVHVPKKLKAPCEERFKELFSGLATYRSTELSWKTLKKDFAIEIKSSKPADIVEARDLLCKELEGEIIDCSNSALLSCLLNKVGQEHLHKVEKDNGCVIITDFRSGKIHLHGIESKISKTQQDINSYLTQIEGSEQGLVLLKGYDKPPGLMKLIMCKYGSLLDGLAKEFKLQSVSVDWKKHSLQVIGSKINVEKACQNIAALEKEARKNMGLEKETSLPDCIVCMCPVEKKEALFRLEVCGHAYCLDCLQHQMSYAVDNKDFPLKCAKDDCGSYFVWRNIKFALAKKWIREDKLISMSVNAFVLENKDKYKFCLTPNCPVVYEVTVDADGHEFNCPLCFASICTTCHIAFHAGMTCQMAKSGAQAESELTAWVAKNPSKRKLCPGCKSPIEKIEGCQKMHCTCCRTYFCWICLKIATTEDECYRHLHKIHGGIL